MCGTYQRFHGWIHGCNIQFIWTQSVSSQTDTSESEQSEQEQDFPAAVTTPKGHEGPQCRCPMWNRRPPDRYGYWLSWLSCLGSVLTTVTAPGLPVLHQYNLYYWHLYVPVHSINRAIPTVSLSWCSELWPSRLLQTASGWSCSSEAFVPSHSKWLPNGMLHVSV